MQFINSLVSRLRAAISCRRERITANMPLRMAVGRFGIWLVKVGRALQLRYANWNSEFRLQREFFPNPDICALHVSEPVTREPILSFYGPDEQPGKMTPLVRALFNVKGVARVSLHPYDIDITRARVFGWQELLPEVEQVVLEHLTGTSRHQSVIIASHNRKPRASSGARFSVFKWPKLVNYPDFLILAQRSKNPL